MGDVEEVVAEPIEHDIELMSALDVLMSGITAEAEALAREYMPREIKSEEDYKQSKRERTDARKRIASLRQRYTDAMRDIKQAVAEADARAKAALAPLDTVDIGYKLEVDAYEERWKLERRAMLAQEYADFAPDLVPLVPFDKLCLKFGTEKGKQWDARSMSDGQAVAAMQKAVERIAADEQVISTGPWEEEDRAALKADYFATLDLSGALRRTQEAKEQRERIAELERLRQERMSMPEPEPEPRKPLDTGSSMSAAEYVEERERMGTPLPESAKSQLLQDAANIAGGNMPGDRVPDYVFAGYGNQAQADAFIAFCNRTGIKRRVKMPTHGNDYKLSKR